jgi:peptide/nickel transport system ATP-binding protein
VAREACATTDPALEEVAPGHRAACLYAVDAVQEMHARART